MKPPPPFPFTAIVGQDELRLALLLNAIDPHIGGVLIRGERGTAKSTAARGLAALLPPRENDDPPPFVELPLGATEDRVTGTLDLESVLREGLRQLRPGLLSQADGGVLYVDEVNLLPDHLVDLLLDSAASGSVRIERDGISETLPARFILIGSMNPEEGELRPQFIDRFGLCVHVTTPSESEPRIETIRRRLAYETAPETFVENETRAENELRERIAAARARLNAIPLDETTLAQAASLCVSMKLDGVRGDLALVRTARAIAAWENAVAITDAHIRQAARLALSHRKRKKPFEPVGGSSGSGLGGIHDSSVGSGGMGFQPMSSEHGQDARATQPSQSAPPNQPAPAASSAGAIHVALEAQAPRTPNAGRRDDGALARGGVIRAVPLRDGDGGALAVAPTLTAAAMRSGLSGTGDPPAGSGGMGFQPMSSEHGQDARATQPAAFALTLLREDLRRHERAKRGAARVLFIVDASGSMGAQRRLSLAKGAATGLLTGSYQKRDEVALMVFRGESAELLETFTRDVDRIERALRDVPTGGRTPLASALATAAPYLNTQGPAFLVLFTDGRANVPLNPGGDPWRDALDAASQLAPLATGALVVDCETGAITLGRARELAGALGAECEPLAALDEPSLTLRIRKQTTA